MTRGHLTGRSSGGWTSSHRGEAPPKFTVGRILHEAREAGAGMRQAIDVGSTQDWRGEVRRLFDLAGRLAVERGALHGRRAPEEAPAPPGRRSRSTGPPSPRASAATSAAPPRSRSSSRSTPRSRRLTSPSPTSASGCVPSPWRRRCSLADTASEIRWEPKGEVLILAPWNYPVFLTLGPAGRRHRRGQRA